MTINQYDYCWLKYTLKRAASEKSDKLICGHSLARFGITEKLIPGLINLSFISQDYYYSARIIEEAVSKIPSIRLVILGTSYVSPFLDLSLMENKGEIARINDVYGKYFGDYHHLSEIREQTPRDSHDNEDDLYNEEMYEHIKDDYFGPRHTRQMVSETDWEGTAEEERIKTGEMRAGFHNRFLKYQDTYEENGGILMKLATSLRDRDIDFVPVVFPSNIYYRRHLDISFKVKYEEQIGKISVGPGIKTQFDFYECDAFDKVKDFVDSDHLNDRGAEKMTNMLRDCLHFK